MITTLLIEYAALVPVALALVGLVCVGVGWSVLRSGPHGPRVLWALAALSAVPVVALTLVPSGVDRSDVAACTVQFALPGPGTVELLANIALFVPPVFFAALVTRRPLPVLAWGSGASVAIEVVQAVVPALGRACDTTDWTMNTLGAVIAVLLAAGTAALTDRAGATGGGAGRRR